MSFSKFDTQTQIEEYEPTDADLRDLEIWLDENAVLEQKSFPFFPD